jgi:hypothetical protein
MDLPTGATASQSYSVSAVGWRLWADPRAPGGLTRALRAWLRRRESLGRATANYMRISLIASTACSYMPGSTWE